jgi:hypothetical protein
MVERNGSTRQPPEALCRLQPTSPIAVAVALTRLRTMRVVVSTDDITGFALQRLLDDQPT